MKKILKLISTVLLVVVMSCIVAYADVVDDLCAEYDYQYRYTVEVELDETYKGTGLYEISDDGRLQISRIVFKNKVPVKFDGETKEVDRCHAFVGKKEIVKGAGDYFTMNSVYIKEDDGFHHVYIEDSRHPLHNMYIENDEEPLSTYFVMKYMKNDEDFADRCIVIADNRGYDSGITPIYIEEEVLREAEDTNMIYFTRAATYFQNENYKNKYTLPSRSNTIYGEAIVREGKRFPVLPDEISISETKARMNKTDVEIDFEYDRDKVYSGETNPTFVKWEHNRNSGNYYEDAFIIDGGSKGFYNISNYEGSAVFELLLYPINSFNKKIQEIAPDGKIKVTVMQYKTAIFNLTYKEKKPHARYIYLIKFEGNGGIGYGVAPSIDTSLDCSRTRVCTMNDFDGNAGLFRIKDYPKKKVDGGETTDYDYPQIYVGYDEETGAISEIGLSHVTKINAGDIAHYENYTLPIEEIQIDEKLEYQLTKANFNLYDSDYLTKPVVEKARAERGAKSVEESEKTNDNTSENTNGSTTVNGVEYNPDIMFIPVPTEPQGEAVLHPELPLAPKEGDIRITVGGKEIAFDVAPQIEEDRVLVPLRAVFEQLGDFVDWNEKTKTAKIIGGDITIEFVIGNIEVKVNGEEKQMDIPAKILNGRTLVPMRFLSEALGYQVNWNKEARIVSVDK